MLRGSTEPAGIHFNSRRCGGKFKIEPLSGTKALANVRDFFYKNSDLARGLRKREPSATKGFDFNFSTPQLNELKWIPAGSSLPMNFLKWNHRIIYMCCII